MDAIKAQQLANELMTQHGIKQQGWVFQFDRSKRRFGSCQYRGRRITLSLELTQLNDEEQVRDTILHEIAHALTPGHHHDSVWRQKAIEIGCNGSRCYSPDNVNTPQAPYTATCNGCGTTHLRHRKPRLGGSSSCGRCSGGKYNPTFKLNWIKTK